MSRQTRLRRWPVLPAASGCGRWACSATPPLEPVGDVATLLNLQAVQLHGREDMEYVRSLRRELAPSCEIWTALSVGSEPLSSRGGDRLLFDNGNGGTGRSFDWELVEDHPELERSIIAGGIGATQCGLGEVLGRLCD